MPRFPLLISWLRALVLLPLLVLAMNAVRAEDDFLDPEVAFKLAARALDERSVELSFTVAPGYYLYREQFKFSATGATLGTPIVPPGKTKFDETFQKTVETYRDVVRIVVPVDKAPAQFRLLITNQGCADKGLCYPPTQRGADVSLRGFGGDGSVRTLTAAQVEADPGRAADATRVADGATSAAAAGDSASLDAALRQGRFWSIVGVFLLAGVLLSLTPCVLPMLPILSSIIVGHGSDVSRTRGFALAASYSLGMALVYTALGVAAGLAGEGLAAALQNPWVLGAFALGLVALAMSMFGAYELQLPSAFTGRLSEASQRLPAGKLASVFAMGGVSALIVSPCVAAPLAGALVYISQTRDVWLGGTALFSLAAGMSVPLLLVGASAGGLLPRAGAWMDEVKRFFGLLLLGVALYTVQPVWPTALVLALWGALLLATAVLLVSDQHRAHRGGLSKSLWRRVIAAVLAVCGLLEFAGAASGGSNPLQPLGHLATRGTNGAEKVGVAFRTVSSIGELDAALRSAGRPAMLDFYADWCVSCKEMERFTFSDAAVQKKLAGALLLKADVTANSEADKALLKRFQLFGPPGTIFFDASGREIAGSRVIGFQNSDRFLQTLRSVGL
ncbi:MAG TPA: protein-disulfide reductase DsbD [Burkholderiaceae bacterium]|nr:protein-disulfide reductase DsbD [Burkholderiaceae bacterium]